MGRKTKQNKITNPELIAQTDPKNKRLMKDFLNYLRSVGKAETTIKAYTSDLNIFFVWALQNTDNIIISNLHLPFFRTFSID